MLFLDIIYLSWTSQKIFHRPLASLPRGAKNAEKDFYLSNREIPIG